MAQAMACGFENLKPRPQARVSQALGLAWPGFWLPGQASTSLITPDMTWGFFRTSGYVV
jgi:hypothetical protein